MDSLGVATRKAEWYSNDSPTGLRRILSTCEPLRMTYLKKTAFYQSSLINNNLMHKTAHYCTELAFPANVNHILLVSM